MGFDEDCFILKQQSIKMYFFYEVNKDFTLNERSSGVLFGAE